MNNDSTSNLSRSDQLKVDTYVSDESISVFQEELRESEKERLLSGKRRLDLLETVRNRFHTKDAHTSQREIKNAEEQLFREGSQEELENITKRIQREIQNLRAKKTASNTSLNLFSHFQEKMRILLEKKNLAEKLKDPNCTLMKTGQNQTNVKVKMILESLLGEVEKLSNELIGIYKQLDQSIFSDIELESHTKDLFFTCMMQLEKQQREHLIRLYRSQTHDASLVKQNQIAKKIVEQLAKNNVTIAESIHQYLRNKAKTYEKQDYNQLAIQELCFAVSIWRDNVDTYRLLHRLFLKVHEHSKAFIALREMARLLPNDLQLHKKVAGEWINQGQIKFAIQEYQSLISHSNADMNWRKTLAKLLLQSQQYSDIPNVINPYLQSYPQDFEAGKWLGTALVKCELYPKAVNLFKLLLEEIPDDLECIQNLVQAYRRLHLHNEAIQLLTKSLENQPNQLVYEILLAAVYQEIGESSQAVSQYEQLLETNPSSIPIILTSSKELILSNQYEAAAQRLKKGLEIDPSNGEMWFWLGKAKRKLNLFDEAECSLQQAKQLMDNSMEVMAELVVLYTQTGQWEKMKSLQKTKS